MVGSIVQNVGKRVLSMFGTHRHACLMRPSAIATTAANTEAGSDALNSSDQDGLLEDKNHDDADDDDDTTGCVS